MKICYIDPLEFVRHNCYLITNLKTKKVYVGVSHKSIEDRFKEHIKVSRGNGKKEYIQKFIVKHGIENFTIELLDAFKNKKLGYEAEVGFIAQYNSYYEGYNETKGGDCGPIIIKYNDETIVSIIKDYCNGILLKDISSKYNINYHSVFDITRLRISETHIIPDDLLEKLKEAKASSNKRKRANKEIIENIIIDYLNGKTMHQICCIYGFTINTIFNILHRTTWAEIKIDSELELKIKEKFSK